MTTKNKSIVALVCGILGIIGGWIPVVQYFTFVLAIVGLVFGALALKDKPQGNDKGIAVAGLVCGIVGTVFGLIGVLCAVCVACSISAMGNAAMNELAALGALY